MPVLVRNAEPGPTVFSDPKDNIAIEWQGAGDPSGEDLQQVPDEVVVNNTAFIRCVQRGIFIIEEASDATREALARQTESWKRRKDGAKEEAIAALDQQANNDIVTVPCIGPANRGAGECSEPVPVRDKAKADKPPLCSRHQALASQYVLTESEEFDNDLGHGKRSWQRMTVSARQ